MLNAGKNVFTEKIFTADIEKSRELVKLADENPSIGLILCHSMDRPVVELAVRRYPMPMGVATYRTSEDVPPAYKALKPLLEGSQKLLAELNCDTPDSSGKGKRHH